MFERIRTIKGRRYRYREKRWREGGKVRSRSWSLGPVDGALYDGEPTNLGHGGYLGQMAQYPDKENSPDKSGEKVANMVGADADNADGSPDSLP